MIRFLRIELRKNLSYSTFWVVSGLYFFILTGTLLSSKLLIDFLTGKGEQIANINATAISLFNFPDVWQNVTYIAGWFKIVLGIFIIISICNELSFQTMRKNVTDGLSRRDFLVSKILFIVVFSFGATVILALISVILGVVDAPDSIRYFFTDIEFLAGYFIQLTVYFTIALFIGLLIKRTGLAFIILLAYNFIIEPLIVFRIHVEWIRGIFPMKSINNIIHSPFGKYALQEIQDYLAMKDLLTVTLIFIIFTGLIYRILKKRDL